jgi:hypothetical protein
LLLIFAKKNKMKNTLLLTALCASLLFANGAMAQIPGVSMVTKALPKVSVGIKLGANFQQISGSGWEKTYKPGIVGGAFVGVTKNKIGIQLEALVKSVTFNSNDNISPSINGVYLDVPLLLEYKLIPRLWLQLGPQFSELLSAKESGTDVKKDFNSSDFAGVLGLEARLPLHLTVSARYILGFTNINNESVTGTTDAWNNRTIQLSVGLRFL